MSEDLVPPPPVLDVPVVEGSNLIPKKSPLVPILISLLILGLLVLAGYFYWQNTQLKQQLAATPNLAPAAAGDPTVNWKTYVGDGFSFQYPQNWNGGTSTIEPIEGDRSMQLIIGSVLKDCFIDTKLKTVVVDGKDVSIFKYEENPKAEICSKEGIDYLVADRVNLALSYGKSNNEESLANMVLDSILSTYKFSQSDKIDVSQWKSYENTISKYQISYPNGWKISSLDNLTSVLADNNNNKIVIRSFPEKDSVYKMYGKYFANPPDMVTNEAVSFLKLGNINYRLVILYTNPQYISFLASRYPLDNGVAYYAIEFLNKKIYRELTITEKTILSTFKFTD